MISWKITKKESINWIQTHYKVKLIHPNIACDTPNKIFVVKGLKVPGVLHKMTISVYHACKRVQFCLASSLVILLNSSYTLTRKSPRWCVSIQPLVSFAIIAISLRKTVPVHLYLFSNKPTDFNIECKDIATWWACLYIPSHCFSSQSVPWYTSPNVNKNINVKKKLTSSFS